MSQGTDLVSQANDDVSRQMGIYALSAAAAGVSLLALASPAKAEVVITKTQLPVTHSAPVFLDLNKDGIPDFKFTNVSGRTSYFYDSFKVCADLCGMPGNEVVGGKGNVFIYASALGRGAKIGPSDHFSTFFNGVTVEGSFGDYLSGRTEREVFGKWGNDPQNRYLGVKFRIKGAIHYGWVRLAVKSRNMLSISATITGYAYETIPNKPIVAGTAETASVDAQTKDSVSDRGGPSLGMLAAGADGLTLWRRDETSAP